MIREHISMALTTIRYSKLRSLLTMLGIIIGVASVTIVISIGEGVKNQVAGEVNSYGANLIQITPGKSFTRNEKGEISSFNFTASLGASTLSEADLNSIISNPDVESATPIMLLSGSVTAGEKVATNALIVATNADYPKALNQKIERGDFFKGNETGKVAVIGSNVAETIFGGNSALGGVIEIRGEKFVVAGVMEKRSAGASFGGPNLNDAVYIPLAVGKTFNQGVVQISEIDAKSREDKNIDDVAKSLEQALLANHGGEEDFSIAKQSELLKIADSILNIITSFVAAIAAISLFVGGIGIMNIMLVSVAERTREVGLRKALGATRRQILLQFLIESIVLSAAGGLLGIGLAYGVVALITILSDLNGSFSLETVVLAAGVSGAVGIVFGIMPAIKAARKDPIEALRYE